MPPWEGDPDSKARKRLGSDSATHWRRKRPTGTWRMVHTIAQRMGQFRPRHDRPQLAQHQMRRMAAFPAAAAKMLLQAILNASSGRRLDLRQRHRLPARVVLRGRTGGPSKTKELAEGIRALNPVTSLINRRPAKIPIYVLSPSGSEIYVAALRSRATAAASTISAHFSPIMMHGALVLPLISVGMIEASATRRPWIPCTLSS